ncbi:MAG: heme exporter protein CcmB [Alphaproteobacteria bacterium]|nr:heme exporter protein CcmB [Alphaproteobacteria bacterium]
MILTEIHKLYLCRGSLFSSCCFFALALFCFTLALGSEGVILNRCAPPVLWILAALTLFFSTPFFLKAEFQAGLLDEIFLHPLSPSFYLLAKIVAEVLLLGLPLLMVGALFSPSFSLSFVQTAHLLLTLLIGLPALSALGILGGLLTLHTQGGGVLVSLLILPLVLPLLLFALSVMEMTRLGLDSFAPFCLLTSGSLLLVILSVGAGQWALTIAVEA